MSNASLSAWDIGGNSGTNPATDFLGTKDNEPLKIRTNNTQVAQFDVNGRLAIGTHDPMAPIHIKSYPGYSGSGFRVDTFSFLSSSVSYTDMYTAYLSNNQILKVKIQVIARQSDGTQRACFTRSALFYKENGNVLTQGSVQSDFTMKSDNDFNIVHSTGTNYVTFRVKNAFAIDTYWTGHVELEYLSNDL